MFGSPGIPATSSTRPANIAGPIDRHRNPANAAGFTASAAIAKLAHRISAAQ
jgi:hypothetical protein